MSPLFKIFFLCLAPEITEESTKTVEDIIIQRIKDQVCVWLLLFGGGGSHCFCNEFSPQRETLLLMVSKISSIMKITEKK